MNGIIKTFAQAKARAAYLAKLHGHAMCVFPVPEHSGAYALGYRFGVCSADEE